MKCDDLYVEPSIAEYIVMLTWTSFVARASMENEKENEEGKEEKKKTERDEID
jgi:hypothetical protein